MTVSHLREWAVTPIELALDLEKPGLDDRGRMAWSGPAEPRLTLVVAFASTPQLKRICRAVEREVPEKPPAGLRVSAARSRQASMDGQTIAVQPIRALLRLQTRLIRAVGPGLIQHGIPITLGKALGMEEPAAFFVRDFIPLKMLPAFEPSRVSDEFEAMTLRTIGLTIYRLGSQGRPESVLAHWAYANA